MKRYVVLNTRDEKYKRLAWTEDEDPYPEWFDHHWFVYDSKTDRIVGEDGGEPEDQMLVRDWRWVEKELNRAYEEGLSDAKEKNTQ